MLEGLVGWLVVTRRSRGKKIKEKKREAGREERVG